MKYFTECKTLDEAKNLFKKLCFKLHPDYNNGEGQEFIKMFAEFENFKPETKREGDESFNAANFYNIVKQFEGLSDILITFVGSFIWLEDEEGREGATKAQKEEIKSILLEGFNSPRFSAKHVKWYYSPEGYKQKFKSSKNFEEIKKTWRFKSYNANQYQEKRERLTA